MLGKQKPGEKITISNESKV